ncbi:HNH endonuclease [Microlunatus aurantiacus]|uniref:HNH endonuclease n=1 Tax=Microlunatus aurantiacus TaxID=446786 RepID=A0ABP7CKC2_9ACTN
MDTAAELVLRHRIMHALTQETAARGFLTREQLSGLMVDGERRRIIDTSKGIWNPRNLAATLSVVSSPEGPYDDRELDGALFRYAYRAGSIHGDNTKLRRAYELELPIILLRKINTGTFVPVFPVYVIDDDTARHEFVLSLDESVRFMTNPDLGPQRSYVEQLVRRRLHQAEFRGRVLQAYATQCAICNLRLGRLLEAAHIIGDAETDGDPVVPNGLSLCKIHHAAYDADLVGINPDFVVEVNRELLETTDGPMLQYGLQAMNGRALTLPQRRVDRPDRERLDVRYRQFRAAS